VVWASPTSGDTSIPASMSLYKDKEVLQTTVLDKSELHYYDTQTGRWEYSSYFDKVTNEYPVQDTVNYKQHAILRALPILGGVLFVPSIWCTRPQDRMAMTEEPSPETTPPRFIRGNALSVSRDVRAIGVGT
jgi:hypothetical protein